MTILIVFLVTLIGLALLRIPFAYAMGAGVLAGYLVAGFNIFSLPSTLMMVLDSFTLLAVPLFIFAGDLMSSGGVSASIVNFLKAVLGRFRGYLGASLVYTCMFFGAITGSSLVTVSACGGILAPEMIKEGYDKNYTTAMIATSGYLGTLIPPSIPGITYALMAQESISDVWTSTIGCAIICSTLFTIINYYIYGRKLPKNSAPFNLKSYGKGVWNASPKAIIAFIMPIIIFGGIYGGIFTPTEAGAVSVLYGILAGWVIYRFFFKLIPRKFTDTVKHSMISSAAIGILLAFAGGTAHLISLARIPDAIVAFMLDITDSKWMFLVFANIILLLFGMIMEVNTSIILLTPIFLPVAVAYGIDPIHFGAIMLMNLEIGLITPPHAGNLFIACKVTNVTMDKVIRPLMPFYIASLIALLLVTYFPEVSLFIPSLIK